MKPLIVILALVLASARCVAVEPSDYATQTVAAQKKIEEIRARVSPALGDTEAAVLARFGRPSGATTPEREALNGRYDVDGIGLYRWFYRSDVFRKEEATGLKTVFSIEMVVYFVGQKVVGSTLEVSPPNARRYISSDGVVESYSGSPPVLRRRADGSLGFDYHVEEGVFRTRNQLLALFESYEAFLTKPEKKPNQAQSQPTGGSS